MIRKIFNNLASIKLAVVIILALTASLALATTLESNYDTPTAQYFVYRSWWFKLILCGLGVNIIAVMVDRWPWRPRHAPFLLAHVGIIMLLFGSWATDRYGLDGSLRVAEGDTSSVVDIDQNFLSISGKDTQHRVEVPWIPPDVTFKPIILKEDGITIDKYISRAEGVYDFRAASTGATPHPAVQIEIRGGVMKIQQALWLWSGHPSWAQVRLGPAVFQIGVSGELEKGKPVLAFQAEKDGTLSYVAQTAEGSKSEGHIASAKAEGTELQPGWKGGVTVKILKYLPDAIPLVNYKPARVQYGKEAPPSAIHLVVSSGEQPSKDASSEVWLGLGEHAILQAGGKETDVSYSNRRLVLPFGIKLNHFSIQTYQGSRDPSSYASDVTVVEGGPDSGAGKDAKPLTQTISMNEPLHHQGITLYQASFEDAEPRPTVTILSVNRDPGRVWKYLGSLLIVLGSIVLFAVKSKKGKVGAAV